MNVGVPKPLFSKSSWLYIEVSIAENLISAPISFVLNLCASSDIVKAYGKSSGEFLFLILLDLLNLLFPLMLFFFACCFNFSISASSPFIFPSGGGGAWFSCVSVVPAPCPKLSFWDGLSNVSYCCCIVDCPVTLNVEEVTAEGAVSLSNVPKRFSIAVSLGEE